LKPYMAEQTFKGTTATLREANLLHLSQNALGMRMLCTTFDETGAPIEYTEAYYPDTFEMHLTMRVH